MQIRPFEPADEEQVIALWHACNLVFPANDPRKDIARKRQISPELFLVGVLGGRIVATVMGGYEGHRGWLNYLAVHPEHQKRGYGKTIVAAIEQELAARGCPKINLQVRTSNTDVIRFYESLGYHVDRVISMGKRLIDDSADER